MNWQLQHLPEFVMRLQQLITIPRQKTVIQSTLTQQVTHIPHVPRKLKKQNFQIAFFLKYSHKSIASHYHRKLFTIPN